MNEKISVLIPTRKRVHRLETLFRSYEETTRPQAFSELVFRVDDDDSESQRYLNETPWHVVVGPRFQGYRSMPAFFNEMYSVATGSMLLFGNDDMTFKTHGWDQRLLKFAERYADGVYDLGVRTHNEDNFPFACVSKRMADCLGFLWDPDVYWGDIYLRDVAAWFGRAVKIPEVEIIHDWEGFARRPDEVFQQAEKNVNVIDPHYWTQTHPNAVHRAVRKLEEIYADPCVRASS